MRMLIQTQLSNYDTQGFFILEADSGWQMVMGRVREIVKLIPDAEIHILGPKLEQLKTHPLDVNPDVFQNKKIRYYGTYIQPNALATRFNFSVEDVAQTLGLHLQFNTGYDWVYINDPMQLRNFKALFNLYKKPQPKFAVHSHFIDNPSCPKFPTDASLWLGQVEASIRADINFWQCQSALDIYKEEAKSILQPGVLDEVMAKSYPWDDGYSTTETNRWIDDSKMRFAPEEFMHKTRGKTVIFVPNRVGGRGRSSDYTNCGKFLFEHLPRIHAENPNIAVIAGNPSQKFSNQELEAELGKYGFINLVPDSLLREEYLWVGKHSDIAVGLYDQDSYGGTAARELVDLGCMPLWLDKYEYASLAAMSMYSHWLANFDNLHAIALDLIKMCVHRPEVANEYRTMLRRAVRHQSSYEATTPDALRLMGLL